MGAVRVAAICAELEHAGRINDPVPPELLDDLDRELHCAASELNDLVPHHV
jgi:hypothetical protein